MWPWEHLAVGYLLASLWRRYRSHRPLGGPEAVAAAVGTQVPDLVDKPLGWATALLPGGRSMAHSLPVAVPLVVAGYLLGRRYERADVGAAFAVGYLAHLPADVVYPVALGSDLAWEFLFWPFVSLPQAHVGSVAGRVLELAVDFAGFLATPRGLVYVALELALLSAALLAWRRDGWPGVDVLWGAAATVRARVSPR